MVLHKHETSRQLNWQSPIPYRLGALKISYFMLEVCGQIPRVQLLAFTTKLLFTRSRDRLPRHYWNAHLAV